MNSFELLSEQFVAEINGTAKRYRHIHSGADCLFIENEDENKVFGISFRTPPPDSTGIAHILEHTVLCGSRKYPVKDPFVQLLKGSLQTFLNAFTYPDKTCYPVASCNLQDFHNLVDVYLDAVFYPRITEYFFQQEGWHFELDASDAPLRCKGVVYNEMKGVYSSPDSLLGERSVRSLFPDTPYGLDSGGDPHRIPDLTYAQFKAFHASLYHPSNARIFFYGNDDPEKRLEILDAYLKDFPAIQPETEIPLQPPLPEPLRLEVPYAAAPEETDTLFTVNFRLPESTDPDRLFALELLDHVLLDTPASPLRKALIESELGEDLTGGGLESQLRQMVWSIGLKGVAPDDLAEAEALIFETLQHLVETGIDRGDIEAALNSFEFDLRENNTGGFPRGLSLMLKALNTWLYEADPLALVAFEAPLAQLKERIATDPRFFETLIRELLLENNQRSTVVLRPDPLLAAQMEAEERAWLDQTAARLSAGERQALVESTRRLQELQSRPDTPEALNRIPSLSRSDLDPQITRCPRTELNSGEVPLLRHDLFTGGILYFDVSFDLACLSEDELPWIALLGTLLLETGTRRTGYVELCRRIAAQTGGIHPTTLSGAMNPESGTAQFVLRAKCMAPQGANLLALLEEILLEPDFTQRDRVRQIAIEYKAMAESAILPNGHHAVCGQLRKRHHPVFHAMEKAAGFSTLFFLRQLEQRIESDWPSIQEELTALHRRLITRGGMRLNLTGEAADNDRFLQAVEPWTRRFPDHPARPMQTWTPAPGPEAEAFTLPTRVNFVGKAVNLYQHGGRRHGANAVISRYLQTTWLWEQIRVQGGAYGASCGLDSKTGVFHFASYRDPNLEKTLEAYDRTVRFLRETRPDPTELDRAVIGTIGAFDKYQLPDAKGYSDFSHELLRIKESERQRQRDEVLATRADDFQAFADALEAALPHGNVAFIAAEETARRAEADGMTLHVQSLTPVGLHKSAIS